MENFIFDDHAPNVFLLVCILLDSTPKVKRLIMIDCIRKRKGVTFVELMMAVALLAILGTFMVPSLGRWVSHFRIKGVARNIAACFRLAQMTAVQRNQECTVRFNTNTGNIQVFDGGGVSVRALDLAEFRAAFDRFDFADVGGDGLISVIYNTRGIPSDEAGNPLTPPGGQDGQRVFLDSSRGEEYWVEVTPVGNVRYDKT
jgi:prepilin-type N-terminal cleavage/methylation domain-containing protein